MVLLRNGSELNHMHTVQDHIRREAEDPGISLREKVTESVETLSTWAGDSPHFDSLAELEAVGEFAMRCIDWSDVLFYVHRTGSGRPLLDTNSIETLVEIAKRVRANVLDAECGEHLRGETRVEARRTLGLGEMSEPWEYYAVAVEAEVWEDLLAPVAVRLARQHRVVSDDHGKALVHAPAWFAAMAEASELFERCERIEPAAKGLDLLHGALALWEPWREGHVMFSYSRALRAVGAVWRKETRTPRCTGRLPGIGSDAPSHPCGSE